MTVTLTSNFFQNARGLTLADGGGVTWSINKNTNAITATTTAGSSLSSVGLSDASTTPIYTVGSSPLTSNGTLSLTLNAQSAATVFAGPATGAAAQPTFRGLALTDLPGGYPYSSLSGAPAIPSFQSGTFTGTLTGVTGTVTATLHYTIVNNICTVSLANAANFTGTSNATTLTITGLPAACQPATQDPFMLVFVLDNGVGTLAIAEIASGSGTITFGKAVVSGTTVGFSNTGFTSTGTKGMDATVFTYSLQ